jgi:two-component system sensor histidine kinase MtrB
VEADARRRGIELAASVPDDVSAQCAPEKVERVLVNLLTNALRHTPSDGSIAVRVEQIDREVRVTVEDTGEGLDDEARLRMFDRFWRADPARARTTGGTGLGLAIALEDARLHAGSLDAWGRPGQGASFRLTLPRRAGIALREPPVAVVPPSHGPHVTTGQTPVLHPPTGPSPTTIPDLADAFDPDDAEVR